MSEQTLFKVTIDNITVEVPAGTTILQAARKIGGEVAPPAMCFYSKLKGSGGKCRTCLVEVSKGSEKDPRPMPKLVASCRTTVMDGMEVKNITSEKVVDARAGVVEFLLLNHPLDCPICDQGGECDLQDQAMFFGSNFSRNYFSKRSVEDKSCNNLIKTIMNRCIHCTRCVRFGEEVCGVKFFGTLNRGLKTEIGNYILKLAISKISANVVDLCPVGALTLKPSPFKSRSWEIFSIAGIDLTDSLGTNIYLLYKGDNI